MLVLLMSFFRAPSSTNTSKSSLAEGEAMIQLIPQNHLKITLVQSNNEVEYQVNNLEQDINAMLFYVLL